MHSLSTPPIDPGQVVIVIQRTGDKVIAMTFKYKKGRWVGQSTGDKYTTEELVGAGFVDACWIASPLQPIYSN